MKLKAAILVAGFLFTAASPVMGDPVGTQVFTVPTAETQAKDSVRLSNTLLTLTQLNIGLTDDLQLGINTVWLAATALDLKYRFIQGDTVQMAVLAGGGAFMLDARKHLAYVRPVATFALHKTRLTVGGSATWTGGSKFVELPSSDPDGYPIEEERFAGGYQLSAFGAVEQPLSDNVKFMGELQYMYAPKKIPIVDGIGSWSAATVGLRFHRDAIAVDAGLFVPISGDLLPYKLLGIPLLSFSYLFE